MKRLIPSFNTRSGRLGLSLLAGLALSLSSCAKREIPASDVLATVGAVQIRTADFQREVERRRAAGQPVPDKQVLLQEMVSTEALLQRAQSVGLDNDPEVRREINNLLIGKLLDRELMPQVDAISVSTEEVKADYEQHIEQYTHPAMVRLALLFEEKTPLMSEAKHSELRERMTEARRLVLATPRDGVGPAMKGFGSLAIDYSEDQASRYRGGDIGWLDAARLDSRWPRTVLEKGCALETGQVSDLIETDAGFYLVMKTDERASCTDPLSKVEASLRQSLLVQKRRDCKEAFRQESARLAGAQVNSQTLAAVEMPARVTRVAQREHSPSAALPGAQVLSHEE